MASRAQRHMKEGRAALCNPGRRGWLFSVGEIRQIRRWSLAPQQRFGSKVANILFDASVVEAPLEEVERAIGDP